MHNHAGAQTAPHTSVSAFLLAAEQMIGNAVSEVHAREGHSDLKDELVTLANKMYRLRLTELDV